MLHPRITLGTALRQFINVLRLNMLSNGLQNVLPIAIAFLAGVALPLQAASNAAVSRMLGHSLWGTLTSLSMSVVAVSIGITVQRVQAPLISAAASGPWWIWIGGVFGAFYVGSAAAFAPKLGTGAFLALVVAGQMIATMFVDHFGLMGLEAKPVHLSRILGVSLILAGVMLIQLGSGAASAK